MSETRSDDSFEKIMDTLSQHVVGQVIKGFMIGADNFTLTMTLSNGMAFLIPPDQDVCWSIILPDNDIL